MRSFSVDPEMLLLRRVTMAHLAAYQWELMLRHERDVLAQLQVFYYYSYFFQFLTYNA